jgi:hypothetical protein
MCQITKPARTLSIIGRLMVAGRQVLLVEIKTARESALYMVEPCVPFSGCGRAWTWQGVGFNSGSCYEVNLGSGEDDGTGGCECRAKAAVCQHLAATRKLLELGKL